MIDFIFASSFNAFINLTIFDISVYNSLYMINSVETLSLFLKKAFINDSDKWLFLFDSIEEEININSISHFASVSPSPIYEAFKMFYNGLLFD